MFTLEGKIYLEVKLAPHSFYAFHIEAQSIKGDVKPPLLMFNSASCYGPRQGTGGKFMRFNGSLRMKSGSIPALSIVSNH